MSTPVKVVLMAGGNGARFWPRSSPELPKQFLDMDGTGSLLRKTYSRARALVNGGDVYVSTQQDYAQLVLRYLPELPEGNLILEPEARDTAPALGLSAVILGQADPNTVMVALPSDHLVGEEDEFRKTLTAAIEAAKVREALVTIGIRPSRPETGYGYIQLGTPAAVYRELPLFHVAQFKEKPSEQVAEEYLKAGNYLWNSGIFVWRVGVFRKALAKHLPELERVLDQIDGLSNSELRSERFREVFATAPRISIDYGLLEKTDQVYSVIANFTWDDLGTWSALARLSTPDENGNLVQGPVVLSNASNVFVQADERVIAVVGVSDLIVVESENGILVCSQESAQNVKNVANAVRVMTSSRRSGLPLSSLGKVLQREWGEEQTWAETPGHSGKFVHITSGRRLSHEGRAGFRSWYVQSGIGHVLMEKESHNVKKGDVITINPGVPCVFIALTSVSLLEIYSETVTQ